MVDRIHAVSLVTTDKSSLPVESDVTGSMVVSEKVSGPTLCESAPDFVPACSYSGAITMVPTINTGTDSIPFPDPKETTKKCIDSEWQLSNVKDNVKTVITEMAKRPLGKWIDVDSFDNDTQLVNSGLHPSTCPSPSTITSTKEQSSDNLLQDLPSGSLESSANRPDALGDLISVCNWTNDCSNDSNKVDTVEDAPLGRGESVCGDGPDMEIVLAKEEFTASLQLRRTSVCSKETEIRPRTDPCGENNVPSNRSDVLPEVDSKCHIASPDKVDTNDIKDIELEGIETHPDPKQQAPTSIKTGSVELNSAPSRANTHKEKIGYTNSISISKVSENEYKSTLKSHRPSFRTRRTKSSRILRLCIRENRVKVAPVLVDAQDQLLKIQLPKSVRKKKFLQQIAHSRAVVRILKIDKSITKLNVYSKSKKRSTKPVCFKSIGRKSHLNLRKRPKIHPKDEQLLYRDDMEFKSEGSDSASDTCHKDRQMSSSRTSTNSMTNVVSAKSKRLCARKSTSWDYKKRLAVTKNKFPKPQFETLLTSECLETSHHQGSDVLLTYDQSGNLSDSRFDYRANMIDGIYAHAASHDILDLSSFVKKSMDIPSTEESLYQGHQCTENTVSDPTVCPVDSYELCNTDLSVIEDHGSLESVESIPDVVRMVMEDIVQKLETEEDTMTLVIDTVISLRDTTCQLAQDLPQDAHWSNGTMDDGINTSADPSIGDSLTASYGDIAYSQNGSAFHEDPSDVMTWSTAVALPCDSGPNDNSSVGEVLNLCKKKTSSSTACDNESSRSFGSTVPKGDMTYRDELTGGAQDKANSSVVQEEELPTIRPPKRRRRKLPSPPRYNDDNRLQMELPRHNWLLEKLRSHAGRIPPITQTSPGNTWVEDEDDTHENRLVIDEDARVNESPRTQNQSQSPESNEELNPREVLDLSSNKSTGNENGMIAATRTDQFESNASGQIYTAADQKECRPRASTDIPFSASCAGMVVERDATQQAVARTVDKKIVHVIQPTLEQNLMPMEISKHQEDPREQSVKPITTMPPVMPVVLQPHPCVVAITGLPAGNTVPLVTNYIMDKNATVTNNVVVNPPSFNSSSQEVIVSTEVGTTSSNFSVSNIGATSTQYVSTASTHVTSVGPTVISIQPISATSIPSNSQVTTHCKSTDSVNNNHANDPATFSIIHQSPYLMNSPKPNDIQMANTINTPLPPHLRQLEYDFEKHRHELLELQKQVSMNEKQRECLLQQRQSKIQSLCLLEVERNKAKHTMNPTVTAVKQMKNTELDSIQTGHVLPQQGPAQLGVSSNYTPCGVMQRNPTPMYNQTNISQISRGAGPSFPSVRPSPGLAPRVPGKMIPSPQMVNPTTYIKSASLEGSNENSRKQSNGIPQARFPLIYPSTDNQMANKPVLLNFQQQPAPSTPMSLQTQSQPFVGPHVSYRRTLPNPCITRNSPTLGSAGNPIQIPHEHEHNNHVCPHHHPHRRHSGCRPTQILKQAHQNRNPSYLKLKLGPNAVPHPAHIRKPSVLNGRVEKQRPLAYSSIYIPRVMPIECPPRPQQHPQCLGPIIPAHSKKYFRQSSTGAKHGCCHRHANRNHYHYHQMQHGTMQCRCAHMCPTSPHGNKNPGLNNKCEQHQRTEPEKQSLPYHSNSSPFAQSSGLIATPPMGQQHGNFLPGPSSIQRSPVPHPLGSPNSLHSYSQHSNTFPSVTSPINYNKYRNQGPVFIRPPSIQPSSNTQPLHMGSVNATQIHPSPSAYNPPARALNLNAMQAPGCMSSSGPLVGSHHTVPHQLSSHNIPPSQVSFECNTAVPSHNKPVRFGYPAVNPTRPMGVFSRFDHPNQFPVTQLHHQVNTGIPRGPTLQTFEKKAASEFGELNSVTGNHSQSIYSHTIPNRRGRRKISESSVNGRTPMTKKQTNSYCLAPSPVAIENLPDHIRANCDVVSPKCIKKIENANASSAPLVKHNEVSISTHVSTCSVQMVDSIMSSIVTQTRKVKNHDSEQPLAEKRCDLDSVAKDTSHQNVDGDCETCNTSTESNLPTSAMCESEVGKQNERLQNDGTANLQSSCIGDGSPKAEQGTDIIKPHGHIDGSLSKLNPDKTDSSRQDVPGEITLDDTRIGSPCTEQHKGDALILGSCNNGEAGNEKETEKNLDIPDYHNEEKNTSMLAEPDTQELYENMAIESSNCKVSDKALETQAKNIVKPSQDAGCDGNENTSSDSDSSDTETMMNSSNSNLYSASITSPTSPSPAVQTDAEVKVIPLAMMQDSISDEGKDLDTKASDNTIKELAQSEYHQDRVEEEDNIQCLDTLKDKTNGHSTVTDEETENQTTSHEEITNATAETNQNRYKYEALDKVSKTPEQQKSKLTIESKSLKVSDNESETANVAVEMHSSGKSSEVSIPGNSLDIIPSTPGSVLHTSKDSNKNGSVTDKSQETICGNDTLNNGMAPTPVVKEMCQLSASVLHQTEKSDITVMSSDAPLDLAARCSVESFTIKEPNIHQTEAKMKTRTISSDRPQNVVGTHPDSVHLKEARNIGGFGDKRSLIAAPPSVSVDQRIFSTCQSIMSNVVSQQNIQMSSAMKHHQSTPLGLTNNPRIASSKYNVIPDINNSNIAHTHNTDGVLSYDMRMKSNTSRISPRVPMENHQNLGLSMSSEMIPMQIPTDQNVFLSSSSSIHRYPINSQEVSPRQQLLGLEHNNSQRQCFQMTRKRPEFPPKFLNQMQQQHNPQKPPQIQPPGLSSYNNGPINTPGSQFHDNSSEPQPPHLNFGVVSPQGSRIPSHNDPFYRPPISQPGGYSVSNSMPMNAKYNPSYPQTSPYQQGHMPPHKPNMINPHNVMYPGAPTTFTSHRHTHVSPEPHTLPHKVQLQTLPHTAQGLPQNPQIMSHPYSQASYVAQKSSSGHVDTIAHLQIKQQPPVGHNPLQVHHQQVMSRQSPHQHTHPGSHRHNPYPTNSMASQQQQMATGHSYSTNPMAPYHHGQHQVSPKAMFGAHVPVAPPQIRSVHNGHGDNQLMRETHSSLQVTHDVKPSLQQGVPHARQNCYSGQHAGISMEQFQSSSRYPMQTPHQVHLDGGSTVPPVHRHQPPGGPGPMMSQPPGGPGPMMSQPPGGPGPMMSQPPGGPGPMMSQPPGGPGPMMSQHSGGPGPMMSQQHFSSQQSMRIMPQDHIPHPLQQHIRPPAYQGQHVTSPDDSNKAMHPLDPSLPSCHVCKLDANFLCAGCETVWYCSVACQSTAWKSHSSMCYPTGGDRRM